MEFSSLSRQRAILTMEFTLDPEEPVGPERRDLEAAIVADARPGRDELHRAMQRAISDRPYLVTLDIESVEIREGSIIIEVFAVLVGVANAIGYYGQVRQGLNELVGDLRSVCDRFMRQFTPRPMYLRGSQVMVVPLEPETRPPAPVDEGRAAGLPAKERLETYLVLSNGALLVALIGVVIVLLSRG